MKKQIIKQIRNLMHFVVGVTFTYCMGNATGVFEDFDIGSKIAWVIFFGGIAGLGMGVVWEFGNKSIFGIKINEIDILITITGSLSGAVLAATFKDLKFITDYLFWICVILILLDIIRAMRTKNRNSKK